MSEAFDIYSNQISIQANNWDFVFQFGLLTPQPVLMNPPLETDSESLPEDAEIQQITIEQLGTVRVSHAQAKVITMLMKRILKQYEEKNGEITIPIGIQSRLNFTEADW